MPRIDITQVQATYWEEVVSACASDSVGEWLRGAGRRANHTTAAACQLCMIRTEWQPISRQGPQVFQSTSHCCKTCRRAVVCARRQLTTHLLNIARLVFAEIFPNLLSIRRRRPTFGQQTTWKAAMTTKTQNGTERVPRGRSWRAARRLILTANPWTWQGSVGCSQLPVPCVCYVPAMH